MPCKVLSAAETTPVPSRALDSDLTGRSGSRLYAANMPSARWGDAETTANTDLMMEIRLLRDQNTRRTRINPNGPRRD